MIYIIYILLRNSGSRDRSSPVIIFTGQLWHICLATVLFTTYTAAEEFVLCWAFQIVDTSVGWPCRWRRKGQRKGKKREREGKKHPQRSGSGRGNIIPSLSGHKQILAVASPPTLYLKKKIGKDIKNTLHCEIYTDNKSPIQQHTIRRPVCVFSTNPLTRDHSCDLFLFPSYTFLCREGRKRVDERFLLLCYFGVAVRKTHLGRSAPIHLIF